jgi:hypothetical protein
MPYRLARPPRSLRIEWGKPGAPADRETRPIVKRNSLLLAALLAAGAATFLYAVLRRHREALPYPYARPEGGEREGEFELFIGS